ncbi:MAG: PD40 domain-containing protein [Acidobacteria bacterium]|nr:PD40 domain-containing protein [Acidobacteriota bacterium]
MSNATKLLVFDKFTLDLQQHILLDEGKHLPLAPKAFEILVALIENRSRIVTKEELMARVWPDTVVEEINIAKNISLLRKILATGKADHGKEVDEKENGQSDQNPYIRTIPKRGYQFVHEVREVDADLVTTWQPSLSAFTNQVSESILKIDQHESVQEPGLQKRNFSLPPWPYLMGLTLIAVALPLLWFRSATDAESIEVSKLKQIRLDSWKGGFIASSALIQSSHDGNLIAFSKGDAEQTDIYVQQIKGGKTIAVTNEKWSDYSPVWSPDGQRIAYLSRRQQGNELWIIPSLGGKGEMIRSLGDEYLQLLCWSKDGSRIFYTSAQDLFVLDLNSGQMSKLTDFSSANPPKSGIAISNDEKKIAYMQPINGAARIFVASLSGSSPVQVTHEGEQNSSPVWFPDGNRLLYRSTSNGINQLCVAYLDGRKPVQLWSSPNDVTPAYVSPDGRKIFYAVTTEESDIFFRDLKAEAETQLTSDPMLKVWPDVSPDGNSIVVQKTNNGFNVLRSTLITRNSGSANFEHELAANGFDARWSPNGDRLAFLRGGNGVYKLWTVRSDGAQQKQLSTISVIPNGFGTKPYNWKQPYNYNWSPDGMNLVFCGIDPSAMNLWQVSANGEQEKMLTDNTDKAIKFFSPMWSSDGKRLVYLAQTKVNGKTTRSIMVYENGRSRTLFQTDSLLRMVGWSSRGTHFLAGLVAAEETGATSNLKLIRIFLDGNGVESVAEFPSVYFNSLRLSPDGELLGFTSRQKNSDNIWITPLVAGHPRMLTSNSDSRLHFSGPVWLPNNRGIYFSKQSVSTTIWSIEIPK